MDETPRDTTLKRIMIVDDSALDRRVAGAFVEEGEWQAVFAENGRDALDRMEEERPDLVLTDLKMPVMNGLALVRAMQKRHPTIPVILMTAHGSEQTAVDALRAGAAYYVRKTRLKEDLPRAIRAILDAASAARELERVRDLLEVQEAHFTLGYDPSESRALVSHVQDSLLQMCLCRGSDVVRLGTALREALDNAVDHGNLELDSALREESFSRYWQEAEARRAIEPYRDRRVHVTIRLTPDEARFIVRDDGAGFDVGTLPDPTKPENLLRPSGRGILLIRTFMDEVHFNEAGNEITMVMRTTRDAAPATPSLRRDRAQP